MDMDAQDEIMEVQKEANHIPLIVVRIDYCEVPC